MPTPRRAVAAATSLIITLACLAGASDPAEAVPPMLPPVGQVLLAPSALPAAADGRRPGREHQPRAERSTSAKNRGSGRGSGRGRGGKQKAARRRGGHPNHSSHRATAVNRTNGAKAVHAARSPQLMRMPRAGRHAEPTGSVPRIFSGRAFDACTAPSLSALRAWRHSSPYGALGIYIGGRNRACAQPRLNAGWVRSAIGLGWGLLPLYVGSQAPCLGPASGRIDPRHATSTGSTEGRDAARAAGALGLGPASPLYLDMEAYNRGNGACSRAVLQYTAGWSQAVRAAGYLAGFYSSADAGIADLAAAAQRHSTKPGSLPDVIWYARWDARVSTDGYRALGAGLWADHRRIHQYQGNVSERHGGVTLCIDRNAMDAPVAVLR